MLWNNLCWIISAKMASHQQHTSCVPRCKGYCGRSSYVWSSSPHAFLCCFELSMSAYQSIVCQCDKIAAMCTDFGVLFVFLL